MVIRSADVGQSKRTHELLAEVTDLDLFCKLDAVPG